MGAQLHMMTINRVARFIIIYILVHVYSALVHVSSALVHVYSALVHVYIALVHVSSAFLQTVHSDTPFLLM